jgi:hypothetical protein
MIAARGWFSKTALSFDMMFGDQLGRRNDGCESLLRTRRENL